MAAFSNYTHKQWKVSKPIKECFIFLNLGILHKVDIILQITMIFIQNRLTYCTFCSLAKANKYLVTILFQFGIFKVNYPKVPKWWRNNSKDKHTSGPNCTYQKTSYKDKKGTVVKANKDNTSLPVQKREDLWDNRLHADNTWHYLLKLTKTEM